MNYTEELTKIYDECNDKIIDVLSKNASKLADHYDRLNEKFLLQR